MKNKTVRSFLARTVAAMVIAGTVPAGAVTALADGSPPDAGTAGEVSAGIEAGATEPGGESPAVNPEETPPNTGQGTGDGGGTETQPQQDSGDGQQQDTDPSKEKETPSDPAEAPKGGEAENPGGEDDKPEDNSQSENNGQEEDSGQTDNQNAGTEDNENEKADSTDTEENDTNNTENSRETPSASVNTETPAPVVKPGTGSRVIVDPSVIEDHHFWQIGKTGLFAKDYINILEDKSDDARTVGTIQKEGLLYRIKDEDDGWLYVESGDVRGFVKAADVYSGDEADDISGTILKEAGADSDEDKANFDWSGYYAKTTIPVSENGAYTWYRATTKQVVIDKKYAVPNDKVNSFVNVREGPSVSDTPVGTVPKNGYMYVILDDGGQFVYVESGNARGFVNRDYIDTSDTVTEEVEKNGEDSYGKTDTIVRPEDNDAYYYTITSVESGKPEGQIGESVVEYAENYIGNPYVWGGTSLTDGADCSGFVQSIYAEYGVSLPRVAADQANAGTAIPIEDAMPGDLVFYSNSAKGIYHVMIYAGNGKTVEAQNESVGIIKGTYDYSGGLDYAVRVLDQTGVPEIVNDGNSAEITPAETIGGVYTYEKWNTNWASGTFQKALHDMYENYDDEGFGKIGDRYVVACTTTFGRVGDLIDFELDDGSVIKTVMGDAKCQSDAGCNLYGHMNGNNVIEFIVNGDIWYNTGHTNAGTVSCHAEWAGKHVAKAVNYGNIIG